MKNSRPFPSLLLASAFAVLLLLTAFTARAGDATATTIKFSDPTKPGTLRIILAMGDLNISGADTPEISIETDMAAEDRTPRRDGMRVLSESASYTLVEKDNTVTLDAGHELTFGHSSSFVVTVPRNTTVVVNNSFGGEIDIRQLTGDIEVKSLNGEVTLRDVSGGVLVETMNGEIDATIVAIQDGKPLSFTSMNGEIALKVPTDAKANVRLRTQNGAILTDFDEKTLVTKTESFRPNRRNGRVTVNLNRNSEVETVNVHGDDSEIKVAVREAVRAGMEAAREAAEAMREAAQAAREAAKEARADMAAEGVSPLPPIPPVPPVPPMTGGKLVSGTLNGGGTEIYAAAMNGDVVLRKVE